jgi:hypothetical protein
MASFLDLVRQVNKSIVMTIALAVALNIAFPRSQFHFIIHYDLGITTVAGQLLVVFIAVFVGFYINRWLTRLLR